MTLTEMRRFYRLTTAATAYIIGFTVNGMVYRIELNELVDAMFKLDRESSSHGGHAKIRFALSAELKAELMNAGAECIGSAEQVLSSRKNKGEAFEKYETERAGQVWVKDSIPYYMDGDLTVGTTKYQIKFEGASFTNEKVIRKALEWKLQQAA